MLENVLGQSYYSQNLALATSRSTMELRLLDRQKTEPLTLTKLPLLKGTVCEFATEPLINGVVVAAVAAAVDTIVEVA